MAAPTAMRDPLMPAGLNDDEQVAWWVLGAIARVNADGRWTTITIDELDAFDDADWAGLAHDTPEVDGPLTDEQRALIRRCLVEVEDDDRSRPDRWWDR